MARGSYLLLPFSLSDKLERLIEKEAPVDGIVGHLSRICAENTVSLSILKPIYEELNRQLGENESASSDPALKLLAGVKCVLLVDGSLMYPKKCSAGRLVDNPPNQYAINENVRDLEHLWDAINVQPKCDDVTLPEARNIGALLQADEEQTDTVVFAHNEEHEEVSVRVHRLVLELVIPACAGRLCLEKTDKPQYYLQTNRIYPLSAVKLLKRYLYHSDVLTEGMSPEDVEKAWKMARDLECEYLSEYLRQYLEGAPVAPYVSIFPPYWKEVEADDLRVRMEGIMNSTVCGRCRVKFHIKSMERVVDESLWSMYHSSKELVRAKAVLKKWELKENDSYENLFGAGIFQ